MATGSTRDDDAADEGRAVWVTRLTVEAFRGIPGYLALELSGEEQPASAVILGDNGSGKSSIVDALQFALQGELQGLGGSRAAALARSRFSDALPKVSVALSDGSSVKRAVSSADGDLRFDRSPVPGFGRVPLVLRRSDILRFWDTPAAQRQLIFVRYFNTSGRQARETPQERIDRLEAEEAQAKANRSNSLHALARIADVLRDRIPSDLGGFNKWVNEYFFGGYDLRKRRFRNKRRLPRDQWLAINRSRDAIKELRSIERELAAARQLTGNAKREPELVKILEEASADVTRAFRAISPRTGVDRFIIKVGEGTAVALDLAVVLKNGQQDSPGNVLSEANRDLVALLIFISISKAAAARRRAKVIVLDDVFQSVDAPIRLAALDHFLNDLKGWQFLITAHDRLWKEQVRSLLQRRGIAVRSFSISTWSFDGGPALSTLQGRVDISLRRALEGSEPGEIALQAGRLLEQISEVLSWTLRVSVVRREDDKYTLGDLWPPVKKVLSRTEAADAAEEVDRYLHLRNLLGAHPNRWAESASLSETHRFGEGVLGLLAYVWCEQCGRWVERSPARETWVCRCGTNFLGKTENQ